MQQPIVTLLSSQIGTHGFASFPLYPYYNNDPPYCHPTPQHTKINKQIQDKKTGSLSKKRKPYMEETKGTSLILQPVIASASEAISRCCLVPFRSYHYQGGVLMALHLTNFRLNR
ncbi:MAG: hypothetical protein ABFD79_08840 [Phycisphaerales bacterium]